jgi:ubiquinone/menaquinone biosynthesis C-methylase UbiE
MIERARANANKQHVRSSGTLDFVVGDVAHLPFPDGSFDAVVSTMSMHHWADTAAGLAEIERVLRPGGRAVIWDFRPGGVPLHPHMPDPLGLIDQSSLRITKVEPWRWPWRFALTRRIELMRRR